MPIRPLFFLAILVMIGIFPAKFFYEKSLISIAQHKATQYAEQAVSQINMDFPFRFTEGKLNKGCVPLKDNEFTLSSTKSFDLTECVIKSKKYNVSHNYWVSPNEAQLSYDSFCISDDVKTIISRYPADSKTLKLYPKFNRSLNECEIGLKYFHRSISYKVKRNVSAKIFKKKSMEIFKDKLLYITEIPALYCTKDCGMDGYKTITRYVIKENDSDPINSNNNDPINLNDLEWEYNDVPICECDY